MSYDMKAVSSAVYKIDGNMISTFSKAWQRLKKYLDSILIKT